MDAPFSFSFVFFSVYIILDPTDSGCASSVHTLSVAAHQRSRVWPNEAVSPRVSPLQLEDAWGTTMRYSVHVTRTDNLI